MPVAIPLILKGMLDYNPYMRRHKAKDYFTEKFLKTGILDWIELKEQNVLDIQKALRKFYKFHKDKRGDYLKASEIFTPEVFAFMSKKIKGEPTEKNPKFDDLYSALSCHAGFDFITGGQTAGIRRHYRCFTGNVLVKDQGAHERGDYPAGNDMACSCLFCPFSGHLFGTGEIRVVLMILPGSVCDSGFFSEKRKSDKIAFKTSDQKTS